MELGMKVECNAAISEHKDDQRLTASYLFCNFGYWNCSSIIYNQTYFKNPKKKYQSRF
jgi:hypothetical protein